MEVAEQLRAERQRQPRHGGQVLDPDRNPGEGTFVAGADRVRGRQRALGVERNEGVQRRVERLDALERRLHQLTRGHLAATHEVAQLGDRAVEEVGGCGR